MMEEFHAGRCQMESLNKVHLVLLSKSAGAEHIGDFRSISLSNSIYLIITKVLANRLHEVLDGLISPFQSAFIGGQQMINSAGRGDGGGLASVRHRQIHVESRLC